MKGKKANEWQLQPCLSLQLRQGALITLSLGEGGASFKIKISSIDTGVEDETKRIQLFTSCGFSNVFFFLFFILYIHIPYCEISNHALLLNVSLHFLIIMTVLRETLKF